MYTTVTINSSDILLAVINSSDSTEQYSFVLKLLVPTLCTSI